MPKKAKTKEEKAAERQQLTADFFSELVKRVPGESQEYVTKLAEVAASTADTSDFVAEHTMRLADYSRGRNELQQHEASLEEAKQRAETIYRDNVTWHAENKAEYDRMKLQLDHYKRLADPGTAVDDFAGGEGDRTPGAPPLNGATADVPGYITKEEHQKELEVRDRGAVEYEALAADLRHRHQATFGEFLNIRELVEHATKKGQRLQDAYDEIYGDKLREKTDADLETRIKKERDEAATEAREEVLRNASPLPYSVGNHEPTSVDYLSGRADLPETGSKAALDEYWKMQQEKRS